ncbi:MAG: glutamate dehydrogenase, partial [Bacteroidota bacterium]
IIELGGKVLTLSDSSGCIYDPEGIDAEKLDFVKTLKNERRGRIKEYTDEFKSAEYTDKGNPWSYEAACAFPCATQNELDEDDAKQLVKNGVIVVGEGANMPCTDEAVEVFKKAKILHSPGKASNAGGVATSGLEMSQNSLRMAWSREKVNEELHDIMKKIHEQCVEHGRVNKKYVDYVKGANIAGFVKVADAMIAQGV